METQRFVQQNAATSTHSSSAGQRSAEAPVGKTRSISGRSEVRVDPAQNRVRAPRSRADQLARFVAQFQIDTARNPGNVGAELSGQAPMVNRAAPEGLPIEDQRKVQQAIDAIDRGRRQFAHSAGISRTSASSIQSVKTPLPTSTQSGIVSAVSEAIASEVNQAAPAQQPRVAPVAAIRQPFFTRPATAPNERPEVVFEEAAPSTTAQVDAPTAYPKSFSANGLTAEAALQATWEAARQNRNPMTNLALRETQETEVVVLPESLLREIAEQQREFEAGDATDGVAAEARGAQETNGSVSSSITVDLAAWDVQAFRWSQVTDDILAHAAPVMDQLTHYSLDILTGTENRIAVAGLTRGQGTSTIAAAVARWAVANGKRVLLVDADLGNPQLSRSVGLSPNVSWLNLIREDLIPSEAIIRSKASGVCVMPLAAVVTPQTWPGHIYDRLGGLLEQVRHGFDLILMDVGPVGQLSNELSNHALMLDALMIVDENPSSGDFIKAKSQLLKSGVRKFIAAQNSVGADTI